MFWTDEELKELQGTGALLRIGKEQSEQQYKEVLLPIITANPHIFDVSKCGLSEFHRMGSLIMAYSFGNSPSDDDDSEFDEETSKYEIGMVPLADFLNANPKLNNVFFLTLIPVVTVGTNFPS